MAGCDSCQVLRINGIPCHETGCPKSDINPATGRKYVGACVGCGANTSRKVNKRYWCRTCWR